MPKIIKNGVTYIGTSNNAAAVSYDNTSSGLNATNVQGAIDEVNSDLAKTVFNFSMSKWGESSSISSTSVAPLSLSRGIGYQVELDTDGKTPNDINLFTTSDAYSYTSKDTGGSGYMLITIKPETSWMLSFTLNFYGSYVAYSVAISGYNYGANHWHEPNAQLLYSSDGATSKTVYFGYTGNYKLWVAVPKSSYQGLSITNITNGYTKITDWTTDIFDISYVSSLPGTTQKTVNAVNNSVINLIYPVGSIYMSVNNTNPGKWMVGTTWVAWGSGRVPVGVNTSDTNFNTVEKTGGEKTHLLTSAESGVPAHEHTYTRPTVSSSGAVTNGITGGSHTHQVDRSNAGAGVTDWGLTAKGAHGGAVLLIQNQSSSHYNVQSTTHTHNLPNHTHTLTGGGVAKNTAANASTAHNNLQPYITCYMWKRTA